MTVRNEDALEKLYSSVKLICNQWAHFTADFENEFFIKTKIDKQTFETISESVKTNLADAYITSELIFNIINAEDDAEVITWLAKVGEEA